MGVCAYCEMDTILTREHVIPSFICDFQKNNGNGVISSWREKAQKIVGGDAVVKDVCGSCNNIILSKLDSYAKQFLAENGVFSINFIESNKTLTYNYTLLSKWLLKVAYNSARSSGIKPAEFGAYKKLIISDDFDFSMFFISAGLFKPLKLSKSELDKYGDIFNADINGYANPFFVRISWCNIEPTIYCIKQISIGAFVFHIVIFNKLLPPEVKRRVIKNYLKKCTGMSILEKNKSHREIKQLPITFIDSMSHHMKRPEVRVHLDELLKKYEL